MKAFDKSLILADKLVGSRIERIRERHPEAANAQLVKKLETTFPSAVVASGAATGGAAAGTVAAVATAASTRHWFLTASIAHVLSRLRVYGIHLTDLEHQKAVVLAVMAGGGGSTFVAKRWEERVHIWESCSPTRSRPRPLNPSTEC
ncbi:hypothetical protein [Nocardia inohanensis]|uniref:hypothetical protein n=1 Tax=Nocardia inohanensis TaxID=209246 RepID=UPI000A891D08|nr:hypothetical protein [Nocardia inohanensis]